MSRLALRYEYDAGFLDPTLTRDDFGRLSISVITDYFSGCGGFWVQWQDVKEFGESLATYPIEASAPLIAQWGYDMQEGDDVILRVEIAPANGRGDLIVLVEIANEHEQRERVRTSFLTNYPDLEAFRAEVAKLIEREIEEAVLSGR